MNKLKWLWGVLVLLLAACDGDTNGDQTARQTPEVPPTVTAAATPASLLGSLPAPSTGGLILPELDGIDGGLLIGKGDKLYLSWFGSVEPIMIAEGILPIMMEPSPDGLLAAYTVGVIEEEVNYTGVPYQNFEYRLTLVNLDTLEKTELLAVGNQRRMFALLLGWSPDSQTVLVWNTGSLVANSADGLTVRALAGTRTVAWLPDNQVLLFAPEDLLVSGSPLALFRVNPQSGEREAVPVRLDDPHWPDFLRIAGALAAHGVAYDKTAFHDFHRAAPLPDGSWAYIEWSDAVKDMQAPLCATWTIRQTAQQAHTEPVNLFESPFTTFLSDLTALPDGSLLFLNWTLDDCQFFGEMNVELLRMMPGQEPVIITNEIDPGPQANPNEIDTLGYWSARKYAITPDGRYVFWIGKGDVEGISLLNITDLTSGETAALLADVVLPDGAGLFANVFWVPRPAEEE